MDQIELLRQHGLFDAKVPRYTSYPPANHFGTGTGAFYQKEWLSAVPVGSEISIYIHIPFCKRLCWFCACRTQGTKTQRPVDTYIDVLYREIEAVRHRIPNGVRMSRLHLGGGTPTILSACTMKNLLTSLFEAFTKAPEFEFSVEVDPTEASKELLQTLLDFGLNRASLGVQDFAPKVQKAIGRKQSLVQTTDVINFLRCGGVPSLNLDLLYGLPHQTPESFQRTMQHVLDMQPDRLAIYGYAHVPWMSKRQVMIKDKDLPSSEKRLHLTQLANQTFCDNGYDAIGIDHFALPTDSLSKSLEEHRLQRNFQGYTDDDTGTLIGLGASAISRFDGGFSQNAPATAAYSERIQESGLAGVKGYVLSDDDKLRAQIIMDLMCYFEFRESELRSAFPNKIQLIQEIKGMFEVRAKRLFETVNQNMRLVENAKPLVRIVAAYVDQHVSVQDGHSPAV